MPRMKNVVPSARIRLDGYQTMPITDPRVQKAFDWYQEMRAKRKAFTMAWPLLVAALNGELGGGIQTAMEKASEEEMARALEAFDDLIGMNVI